MNGKQIHKGIVAVGTSDQEAKEIAAMIWALQPNEVRILLLAEYCQFLQLRVLSEASGIKPHRFGRVREVARAWLRDPVEAARAANRRKRKEQTLIERKKNAG